MQTIKISTTAKGIHHWESYLIAKQKTRLNLLLSQLDINPWVKRDILRLYKNKVTPENIIPLVSHPIRIFLHHLIKNTLTDLINNSTHIHTD